MVKEVNYPINAKSMRGIHAFLGKIMLCIVLVVRTSVFNHSSSGVPRGRQGYLARTELLVMFDPVVTRTGGACCLQVVHTLCSVCFTWKSTFCPIWVSEKRFSLFQVQSYTGDLKKNFFQFSMSVKHFETVQLRHWFVPGFFTKVG